MITRPFMTLLLGTLVACGGAQTTDTTPAGGGSGDGPAKPAAAGDVSFDVPTIEIKGVVFEPLALGRPGMPLVDAKKKTTLDKQRTTFASTKDPVQKEAHAAILATQILGTSMPDYRERVVAYKKAMTQE